MFRLSINIVAVFYWLENISCFCPCHFWRTSRLLWWTLLLPLLFLLLWFLVNVSGIGKILEFENHFWRMFQVLGFVVGNHPDCGAYAAPRRALTFGWKWAYYLGESDMPRHPLPTIILYIEYIVCSTPALTIATALIEASKTITICWIFNWIFRNERTMPVEVGVCLGQSPPSYEWKAYQTAMFDMHSHQSVDYRKQSGLYKRQRSISHFKSDKLIGQVKLKDSESYVYCYNLPKSST